MYLADAYVIISLVFASISTVCTVLTLWLLHDINRWTGFAGLVYALTLSQLIYDVGFFVKPVLSATSNAPIFAFYLLQITGGLATTLFTNVISYIVVVISFSLRSYDIKKNFASIVACVSVLSVVPALLAALGETEALGNSSRAVSSFAVLYYYAIARVLSIVFNFFCYILLGFRLRRMGWTFFPSSSSNKSSAPVHPVCALANRMVYYPVVQVLTRLPAAWLEFGYDMSINDDAAFEAMTHTDAYKTANTLYSISGPSAGIGFLIIFLVMQPAALRHLVSHLHWLCCCSLLGLGGADPDTPEYLLAAAGTSYPPEGLRAPLVEASSPFFRPQPSHAQSPAVYVPNPSINDESLRHTSSEQSSPDVTDHGGKASFASRSSYSRHLGSYNYSDLDDDQLAALVDRYDREGASPRASFSRAGSQDISGSATPRTLSVQGLALPQEERRQQVHHQQQQQQQSQQSQQGGNGNTAGGV